MSWQSDVIEYLAQQRTWSYHAAGPAASEPTSLAALALLAHGQSDAAQRAIDWLTRSQQQDGSVGVMQDQPSPRWPTALAMLAWNAWDDSHGSKRYRGCIDRAFTWATSVRGGTVERKRQIGHDTRLVGWPWVVGTHSWLEPTAFFALAFRAIGKADHPRCIEAIKLLVDRLLPHGGANYGNTIVLGQELLPHIQPTGLTMLALAGADVNDLRMEKSLQHLQSETGLNTSVASLCFSILGMVAHARRPTDADAWLKNAWERTGAFGRRPYTAALIALAALPAYRNPLILNASNQTDG